MNELINALREKVEQLEAWQRDVYAFSCYLVFHKDNTRDNIEEGEKLLKERDLKIATEAYNVLREAAENSIANGFHQNGLAIHEVLDEIGQQHLDSLK